MLFIENTLFLKAIEFRFLKVKTSENVDTCLLILPGTFIWPQNVSSSSGSSSEIFLITSFWMGVTAHWMGQQIPEVLPGEEKMFLV